MPKSPYSFQETSSKEARRARMQGFHSLPGHAKVSQVFGLERQSYNCKKRRAKENGKRNRKVKMLLAGEL